MRYLNTILFCLCMTIVCNLNSYGQETVNSDSLVADFTYLIEQMELTHPDPYSNYGGKVFFHKRVSDLKNDLKDHSYTLNEFVDKVSSFLAVLEDGHTFLQRSKKNSFSNYFYPIAGKTIPDGLIIGRTNKEFSSYLGCKILKINSIPIDSALEQIGMQTACENIYGKYARLANQLGNPLFISNLSPTNKDQLVLSIETPDGEFMDLSLPLLPKEVIKKNPNYIITPKSWEQIPSKSYMSYKFMDTSKQIMLFKLKSIMARECFEYQIYQHWDGAYEQMQSFYKQSLKKEMPSDTLQALKGIPSISETFSDMLKMMRKEGCKTLIIDLRNNGGGWTPITLPTIYQLYGDRYLQTDMETRDFRLLSPLYLKKNKQTLEELNKEYQTNFKIGDYMIDDGGNDAIPIEAKRKQFIDNSMCDTKMELVHLQGNPIYTPEKIYVVMNEWTFSAAFHYAFFLWKMGATIVGVPCMQAPNTYMEQTPFQLPYSKLKGSFSNAMQVFLPGKDPRAKIFWPDIMLTHQDYQKYKFNIDSEILYLIDMIKEGDK